MVEIHRTTTQEGAKLANNTPEQDAALEKVRVADKDYRQARGVLEQRFRDEMKQRLSDRVAHRDRAVRAARDTGVAIGKIGRALGTKDFSTVNVILIGESK